MGNGKAICDVCGNEFALTRDGMIWFHLGAKRDGRWRLKCDGAGQMPQRVDLPEEGSLLAAIIGIPGPDGWKNKISGQMFEKMAALLLAKGLTEDATIYVLENLYWAGANNFK